ncbi:hypothetical protein POM88_052862 [Heracleum sosnowskyi]|uniref:Exonuclease domain-containing protein n=1 Tax=Heracleum sosnowskyi TaxID=360622 RepID=A0AAD8GRS9_9APIA|nr:hypothetical protein POM88_052862 [Heracleum sosnowskyi]
MRRVMGKLFTTFLARSGCLTAKSKYMYVHAYRGGGKQSIGERRAFSFSAFFLAASSLSLAASERCGSQPNCNKTIVHQNYCITYSEATCDKAKNPHPQEIIEFPSVIVSSLTGQLEACFQTYVRPTCNQMLSEFCKDLTGIQQIQVDRGVTLSEALLCHDYLELSYMISLVSVHPKSSFQEPKFSIYRDKL